MPEPSREAIEAAAESLRLGGSAQLGHDIGSGGRASVGRKVLEAALPIIRRDVAREIAADLRKRSAEAYAHGNKTQNIIGYNLEAEADRIEREYGGGDG